MHRWRTQRDTALGVFVKVLGSDKPITNLTREEVLALRRYWQDRITKGEIEIDTANKNITRVGSMVRVVNDFKQLGLPAIFDNALIRGKEDKQRASYTPEVAPRRGIESCAAA